MLKLTLDSLSLSLIILWKKYTWDKNDNITFSIENFASGKYKVIVCVLLHIDMYVYLLIRHRSSCKFSPISSHVKNIRRTNPRRYQTLSQCVQIIVKTYIYVMGLKTAFR